VVAGLAQIGFSPVWTGFVEIPAPLDGRQF